MRKVLVLLLLVGFLATGLLAENLEQALLEAVRQNNIDYAKMLLEMGANVAGMEPDEMEAVYYALMSENAPMLEVLKEALEVKFGVVPPYYLPSGMVMVKAGTFFMGNTRNDGVGDSDELPVHPVRLTYGFVIDEAEVTNEEFAEFLNERAVMPNGFFMGKQVLSLQKGCTDFETHQGHFFVHKGKESYPVRGVTWWGAIEFCNWKSQKEGLALAYDFEGKLLDTTGETTTNPAEVEGYRLPTEAEWEYSARGGHLDYYDFRFSGSDTLSMVGWYMSKGPQPVARKEPNALGLFDMSGNVAEWCHDWWDGSQYPLFQQENPIGPAQGYDRVVRGGSWNSPEKYCRVANRRNDAPGDATGEMGFRVVRTWEVKEPQSRDVLPEPGVPAPRPGEVMSMSLQPTPSTPEESPPVENPSPVEPETRQMVRVNKGGYFYLGNTLDDPGGSPSEMPLQWVRCRTNFLISPTEVTVAEFKEYCEDRQIDFPWDQEPENDQIPVTSVTWYQAVDFCNWKSEQESLPPAYDSNGNLLFGGGAAGKDLSSVIGYRLPTEVEWEYAARGGWKPPEDFRFAGSNDLDHVGWFDGNSNGLQPVAQKAPNSLGLYDMSGNAWEWCHTSWWEYSDQTMSDPIAVDGSYRVVRGGSFQNAEIDCRVSTRKVQEPKIREIFTGFRIVRSIP
ncbi:MAG TPA: SUMF1/EgtB/PvdO family nonheme iron enzyme [Thermotogota bacterium]|nr:SUMF1/EgtB/PvdO family nonheme iron enzyme [Thermotogota bacterium]